MLVFIGTLNNLCGNLTKVKAQKISKNILLINSYHKGFTWTDQETDGITDTINSSNIDVNIFVEYLDWKNYPNDENIKNMYNTIKYKYTNKHIDMIIATDDKAVDFSLKYRKDLFGNIPIVFCGVYKDTAEQFVANNKNISGSVEYVDAVGTLKTAFNINPKAKTVYVIHDDTETGNSSVFEIEKALKELKISADLKEIKNLRIDNLDKDIPFISKDSIVIMTAFTSDIEGNTISLEKMTKLLSEKINLPLYYFYDFAMGNGSIGGSLLSGIIEGKETGKIAIRVLEGENIDAIPLKDKISSVNEYDYQVLKRFGISQNKLPKDSIIINKPYSFYDNNKLLVWIVVAVFSLLLFLIISLALNIFNRKRAEIELTENHQELTALYEQLAASDEELRTQYEELQDNRKIIENEQERYKLVVDASNDGLWDYNLLTKEIYFSDTLYEILGLNKENKVTDVNIGFTYVHPEDIDNVREFTQKLISGEKESYSNEYRIKDGNNGYKWILTKGKALKDSSGKVYRIAGSHAEINERKLHDEQIKKLAYFDSLTQLPNRMNIIEQIKNYSGDSSNKAAFIFMDLDNFKMINDSFGHAIGDELLKEVGKRLLCVTSKIDVVSRLGGDEFGIFIKNIDDKNSVILYLNKLFEIMKDNVNIEGININTSLSVGIAMFPEDGANFTELLKNADTAMYRAKDLGKSKYIFFEKNMNASVIERLQMENNLREALKNNEFILYYQPQIDLKTNTIHGFEALIRWNSPKFGMVPPMKFIDIAEKTGLIIPIGDWVMQEACKFTKSLETKYFKNLYVSVNVSVLQLQQEDFVDKVMTVLDKTGFNPKYLNLEITESILMESTEANIGKIKQLKEKGIKVSLDDFGKGYSSLTYLRQIQLNTLKIDKAFIDELLIRKEDKDIIATIITLAHNLNLTVVAEGVETKEQFDYLVENDCDFIQGYYISRPIPENQIIELLKGGKAWI